LEKTINSVINQSFDNFEYIVIDGLSSDDSIEIIKKYSNKITYWISEVDCGIYNAMNKGISQATGEYCLFLNSGDHFADNDSLKTVFEKKPSEDIVYCNLELIGNDQRRRIIFPDKLTFYWLYTEFIGHPSTLIKTNLFNRYGKYDESLKVVSDWAFFLITICKHQCTTKHINHLLAIQSEGGISNNVNSAKIVQSERRLILNENFRTFIDDYDLLYNYKFNSPIKRLKRILKKILKLLKL
jgi:glycosyltransferase involved in cell wall biosynthesis